MVKVPFVPSAFSGKDNGHLKIVQWLQMLRIDALRLQHFEKDDFALLIGTIHGRRDETPMSAEPYQ